MAMVRNFRATVYPKKLTCQKIKYVVYDSQNDVRKGADKSLAFPIFLFAPEPKEFLLDGLKKLEQ
jgi:hypothetical protein